MINRPAGVMCGARHPHGFISCELRREHDGLHFKNGWEWGEPDRITCDACNGLGLVGVLGYDDCPTNAQPPGYTPGGRFERPIRLQDIVQCEKCRGARTVTT